MAASDPEAGAGSGGFLPSARRLAETATGFVGTRLQLVATELQEEKLRAVRALVGIGLGLFLVFLGLALAVVAAAVALHRLLGVAGLAGLTVLLLLAGGLVLGVTWRRLREGGKPFAATIEEFGKDAAWLRGRR